MQPCTKRKCTKKDPSIIMNFVLNSFKKTNDEAIRDAINFTASIALFIALYEHYYMYKSDDTKRLLISVDNDVMCFKDKLNSIYSIRNYKYEILKTYINDFNKNIKLSKPILTKYEFVRLLTDRTKQLAQGAKPMLKNIQGLSSKEIAKLELKNKIIPLIIERPVPNSHVERWKLTELEIPEHLFTN